MQGVDRTGALEEILTTPEGPWDTGSWSGDIEEGVMGNVQETQVILSCNYMWFVKKMGLHDLDSGEKMMTLKKTRH